MNIQHWWPDQLMKNVADDIKYDCGCDAQYCATLVLNALLHYGTLTEDRDGYLTWRENARPTP